MKTFSTNRNWLVVLISILLSGTFSVNAATVYSTPDGILWSDPLSWSSGSVPTSSDDVIIQDNIVLDQNATVSSLTIYADPDPIVLTINSNMTLTVTNNVTITGINESATIFSRGTLIIGGDLNFEGLDFATQAQINMKTGSILELKKNIVLNTYGRIYSSTSDAYTVRINGSTAQTITANSQIRYYNLTVANAHSSGATLGGNITSTMVANNMTIESGTFSNGGYSIAGASGKTFTVQNGATFNLSGTSAFPSGFNHSIASGAVIKYVGGNQTVAAPNSSQAYHHLEIGGTGTKTLGGNITVNGNLTLTASTLDASNGNNYSINLKGNWTNNGGTFTPRSGSVSFTGSTSQTIKSNGNSFYDITINNTSTGITLNDDITISNIATLTDGIVSTGAYSFIVQNTSASAITGHSNACFINGTLTRYIATNTSTYAFPVGLGTATGNYYLAELVNGNMTNTSYISVHFGGLANHVDADMNVTDAYMTYRSMCSTGTWHITPNAQPSSGFYDAKLYITNMTCNLSNNTFAVLKRPEGSTSAADWTDGGGALNASNGAGRLVSDGYALRKGLTSFSEFGIGRESSNGFPLPVEVVSFEGKADGEQVVLNWVTATEIQNDYFTIERSADGKEFEAIAQVDGAGNSTILAQYIAYDKQPIEGTAYYRLKQTDFDGQSEYKGLIAVTSQKVAVAPEVSIYPNPTTTNGVININTNQSDAIVKIIESVSGRVIYTGNLSGQENSIQLPTGLGAGLYVAKIIFGQTEIQRRVVIQ
ncbi:MAG: T9SS type A sorting domain-containing protein [Chitinophagales bacterium]|nr:T9SS type A sorting domain-containing protein [Chitinophagales bacterium]